MKNEYTPAPWKVRFLGDEDSDFFVEGANNNKPGTGYGIEILMDDYGEHNGYPREQRLADAQLIAAAPDLLEALHEMLSRFEHSGVGYIKADHAKEKARSAIKKALGE